MKSVSMTVAGLPDIHLFQRTTFIPEEGTAVENLTLRGFKKQTGVLKFEAGEWQIELTASHADDATDAGRLYHVNLSRKDGSPFVLGDDIDNGIINALMSFLAFQCGKWISAPTIVCNPVFSTVAKHLTLREGETSDEVLSAVHKFRALEHADHNAMDELNNSIQNAHGFEDVSGADLLGISTSGEQVTMTFGKGDPTVKLVWVGPMSPRDLSGRDTTTATEMQTWPSLFKEYWDMYIEPGNHEHLRNTVYHYIEAQRVFDDGSIGQALVAAQSTLQAVTRWWNGLDIPHRFGPPGPTFDQMLIKAVRKAKLGQDSGVDIDEEALRAAIKVAAKYRNDVDHGRGRNMEGSEQSVVYCRMHHHNLARLLILAKLGNFSRDARGSFAGPWFLERPN